MTKFAPLIAGFTAASLLLPLQSLHAQSTDIAVEAAAEATRAAEAAADAAIEAAATAVAIAASGPAAEIPQNTGPLTSCADAPPVWISGDKASSDISGLKHAWRGDLAGSGQNARAFTLSKPDYVRLETLSKNDGDPVLNLATATGEVIAQNDDAQGSYNSQILIELPAGDYCVFAQDMRRPMNLNLLVGLIDHPSVLEPTPLACGAETPAETLAESDVTTALAQGPYNFYSDASANAYVKFKVTQNAPLSLSATAQGIDPLMALFDKNGYKIAENNDADGTNARLDFPEGLPNGDYCLGISATTPSYGQINFSAQSLDLEAYKRSAYDKGELAPLDGSHPVRPLLFNSSHGEVILQGSKVTWFDFELEDKSVISLRSLGTPTGADTMLSLYDETGDLVVQVDDTSDSRNAAIEPMVLSKGRYLLALSDRASGAQLGAPLRPVVILAERYIRAKAD